MQGIVSVKVLKIPFPTLTRPALFNTNIPSASDYADWLEQLHGFIGDGVGDIADNTGSIKDSLDITEEDLKYLRDIAEQEAINRFTTAEITIEQTNNNNSFGFYGLGRCYCWFG